MSEKKTTKEAKEMLLMRLNGMTFQQIADKCGVSRQRAYQSVMAYTDRIAKGKRGRVFFYEEIIFESIREHFEKKEEETITSFAVAVFGENSKKTTTMRTFLKGETDSRFTISQIKRICEICGKPFEEVFKEIEVSDDE